MQSSTFRPKAPLPFYERGHLSGAEIFRFGLWMTLVICVVVLVAPPYWGSWVNCSWCGLGGDRG